MVMVYLRLTGGSDLVLRECQLDGIVRRAVRRFAGEFIGRKLKLCYEPLNVSCVTDEKWLLFVIEQVLSNALKYTRAGSITIELEAPKALVIRDTGIGVAPEDLPRIFEKGYTGYNGRGDQKASGLGLYLCRTAADAPEVDGNVCVSSEEPLYPGEFYDVLVDDSDLYDLYGTVAK